LQNRSRENRAGIETISGELYNQAITVMHTGVGEKSTRIRLAEFLEAEKPATLISAGFAGALHDSLAVGDLLLADNRSTPTLLPIARRALVATKPQVGALTTARGVIDSAAMRQQIAQETGAVAVDMETEFIAELCASCAVPMISLRAITDTPNAPFPAPPNVLFNMERQRTELAPLFWYLLSHPAAMPRFISFAKAIGKCRGRLTTALDLLLREAAAL
jgi:adenosylhomocysteine nucleosidase